MINPQTAYNIAHEKFPDLPEEDLYFIPYDTVLKMVKDLYEINNECSCSKWEYIKFEKQFDDLNPLTFFVTVPVEGIHENFPDGNVLCHYSEDGVEKVRQLNILKEF